MSIFSTLGTKLAVGAIGIASLAGGTVAFAATNPTIQNDIKAVQSAIVSKDLNAYKTAANQLSTDKNKAKANKINATTQDELNTMADKQAKQKATQDAITNNDYNAFKANADARILTKITDQASFDKLVTSNKVRVNALAQLDAAVIANDASAYIKVAKNMESSEPLKGNGHVKKVQTDDQILTRFDKDRQAYLADNTVLPSTNFKGRFGMGEGKGFGKGHKNFEDKSADTK